MTPLDEGVTDRLNEGRLKLELLKMDIELRRKQAAWETPRNITILAAAMATVVGVIAGVLGYKIGQTPSPPPVIINLPPQSK
jgi:hypothetical protein